MPKLTDTQLIILSAAAQREGGIALPLPKSIKAKGAALTRTCEALLKRGYLERRTAGPEDAVWRDTADGQRLTLAITEAGISVIDAPADKAGKRKPTKKRRSPGSNKGSAGKPVSRSEPTAARSDSKQTILIGLLSRNCGATLDEAVVALGWQAHSVRGAISGALKKKLGLIVTTEKVDGRGRVYRIGSAG